MQPGNGEPDKHPCHASPSKISPGLRFTLKVYLLPMIVKLVPLVKS